MAVNPEQVRLSPVERLSQLRKEYITYALVAVAFGVMGPQTPIMFAFSLFNVYMGAEKAIHADKIKKEIFADNEQRFRASLDRD